MKTNYLIFRRKYTVVIYFIGFFFTTLSVFLSVIWKNLMFYVFGFIALLCFLESLLIKCPHCGKRPVKYFSKFPVDCPHCKKQL